jgi:hypothetical protein
VESCSKKKIHKERYSLLLGFKKIRISHNLLLKLWHFYFWYWTIDLSLFFKDIKMGILGVIPFCLSQFLVCYSSR